ncbi:hypothetical protein [Pseudoalteromonas rubra]|uniref:6-bladed beta-propeller n=1 Tax=Pseudoalteromonas rubra TaxID=43658 RepID=A0A5S3X296_9GAMM|nr:hypothetical protein [Pseudoalteromonas rubra]TMP38474.1 hypothetical protein CWB98_07015 [Pseudoalteromonas rubra]
MERRTFLKTSSYLCASGVLPVTALAANSTSFTFSEQDTQRVSRELLDTLAIEAPKVSIESPNGDAVQLTLKPAVARRYNSQIFIYFETSSEIHVFDLSGNPSGTIKLPQGFSSLNDFAIEPNQQLLYLIERGQHSVTVANFYGEKLTEISEFGTELDGQLNGPKKITLDTHGHIHILEMGTASIKVFSNNGVFLYSYGRSRLGKKPLYRSLDGTQHILVSGGKLNDRKWVFNIDTRKLSALN